MLLFWRSTCFFQITALFLLYHIRGSNSEVVSLTIGAGAVSALGMYFSGIYKHVRCKFYECCDGGWIHNDIARSIFNQFFAKIKNIFYTSFKKGSFYCSEGNKFGNKCIAHPFLFVGHF